MKKRLPRTRRWEYLQCILQTAHERGSREDLEAALVETKIEFEIDP